MEMSLDVYHYQIQKLRVILEKEVLVLQKEIEFHKKEIQAIKNIQQND